MIYVIDTNSLTVLKNFYPATFATLWTELDGMVASGELVSVEEVRNEAVRRTDSLHLLDWIDRNGAIFAPPTAHEMEYVAEIFKVRHFQQLVGADELLRGGFVADPWLIARARAVQGCVVIRTAQAKCRENSKCLHALRSSLFEHRGASGPEGLAILTHPFGPCAHIRA